MIRLIIQEMEDTLVEVRSSSARVLADRKAAARKYTQVQGEVVHWESKAKLAISKGREDLAKAALQEKRAIEEALAAVELELSSTDDHIAHLNEEISQLQAKLSDAKAKQKAIVMRSQTVESRLAVKRQVHRSELDDAFSKFERFERRMDAMESELEAMEMGQDGKSLAAEIDALEEDEWLADELERLKASMSQDPQASQS